jgi:tRNA 2-thiouridine synthesizing protein A
MNVGHDAAGCREARRCPGAALYNFVMLQETKQRPDREVDARGLNCPLPILRTKKALNDMTSGQLIRVLATDPASVRDFQAFSRQTGHDLVEHGEQDGAFFFLLKHR